MNDRERFLACMSYQTVDRIPYRPQGFWRTTLQRWRQEGMPEGSPSEIFGFDNWQYMPVDVTLKPGLEPRTIESTDRWDIVVDEKGITKKLIKPVSETSMPEWIDFPVKNRQDWLKIREHYDPDTPGRYPEDWDDRVAAWKDRDSVLGLDLYNGLYMTLREWMGPEELMLAFYDQPDLVAEMVEFYTDFLLKVLDRALREVEIDYVSFSEDMAFKNGPFISPQMFGQFLQPCYKRLADRFAQARVGFFVIDSDGNPEPLIPGLLEAGVVGIHPCEAAAGMDVVRLRETYGRDLRLWCGIDKRVLARDRAAIEAELTAKLPPLIEQGGYIPQIDHSVPPNVSYDNFRFYWDTFRRIAER
jgi:uroporphyrinogen decarboxylase